MIQNIIFDMGNVLMFYDPKRYVDAHIENEADRAIVLRELFHSVEWIRLDRGNITQEEAAAAVCARLPEHLHHKIPVLLDHWHEDIQPIPGIEALLQELHEKGYNTYVLSNTSTAYRQFRRRLPAISSFTGEFISADFGVLKPDLVIFHSFCEKFGLKPQTCMFIDDLPCNVEAATFVGMSGFLFRQDVPTLRKALREYGVDVETVMNA